MGSSTSAKRGYDTESVAWLQPHPPPPPPRPLALCGRVGIRLSHTGREERPRATAETGIWWRRHVGYWGVSVIYVLDLKPSALIICLPYISVRVQYLYVRTQIKIEERWCARCRRLVYLHHTASMNRAHPQNDCSTAGQEPQMSSESCYSLMRGKEEVRPPESAALRWVN